jgi:transcriptional regulator with XRE-family HTH domain
MGSASHCLYEWAEPNDDNEADVDDRRESGDDLLEFAERDPRRARRTGRRNIALWDMSSASGAAIPSDGRLIALGRAIYQLRAERDISVEQLAGAAGLKRARLEAIEAGRLDPRYDVLFALSSPLGATPSVFITRAEAAARNRTLTVGGQVMRWTIHDGVVMVVLTPDKALDREALLAMAMEVECIFDEHVARGASASANFKAGCVEVDIVLDHITAAEIANKLNHLEQGA